MRYSTEPKYKRYVQGSGFFSFAWKFGDKYGKKLFWGGEGVKLIPLSKNR